MPARTDISPLSQLMKRVDAVADGAAPMDAIPTGFPSVDRILGGGLRRGDLVVLGGDVGAGKSALALACALRASAAGHRVELYTTESAPDRVLERVLAMEGRATVDSIRQGTMDEATRASVGAAALRLRDRLPHIEWAAQGWADQLSSRLPEATGASLVVVDALQGLAADAPQSEALARAVRALKSAAVERRIAMLVTSHLPALDRTRSDLRPTLDDFGALGAVKQHADIVLGLYREELYHCAPGQEGATELAVLKNRGGPATYVDLYFYKHWLRFEDMVDPDR